MAGKHEPASSASFYLSLATSTLRALILVAAVAGGVFLLAQAFDSNPSQGVAPPASPTSPGPTTPGTGPTTGTPTTSPSPAVSPPVQGVVVQVLNGTTTTGLAANTSETLRTAGYTVREPGNFEETEQTTVYYQADFLAAAQGLQRYFPTSRLEVAPDSFPDDVHVTVVLGADYSPEPSPT